MDPFGFRRSSEPETLFAMPWKRTKNTFDTFEKEGYFYTGNIRPDLIVALFLTLYSTNLLICFHVHIKMSGYQKRQNHSGEHPRTQTKLRRVRAVLSRHNRT